MFSIHNYSMCFFNFVRRFVVPPFGKKVDDCSQEREKTGTGRTPRLEHAKFKADLLTKSYTSPVIPVLDIAKNYGVDVIFDDLGCYREEVAGLCDFERKRLYINSTDSLIDQIFTMAHELGHWVLHRDYFLEQPDKYPVLEKARNKKSNDPYELEADHFARNLLAPDHLLLRVKTSKTSVLANAFFLSREDMEIRKRDV